MERKNYPWPLLNTKDMQTKKYHSASVRSSGDNAAVGLLGCGVVSPTDRDSYSSLS